MSRIQEGYENELPEGSIATESDKVLSKKKKCMRLLERDRATKNMLRSEWESIQDDYDLAGNVQVSPHPSEIIHSHITRTVVQKIKQKLAVPKWDISILKDTKLSEEAKLLTSATIKAGVELMAEEANIYGAFKGRQGAFFRYVLFGDCFLLPTWDERKKAVVVKVHSLDDIVVDSNATDIRGASDGNNLNHFGIIYDFDDYDDALEAFPFLKGKGMNWGTLPTVDDTKQMEKSMEQFADTATKSKGQVFMEIDLFCEEIRYWAGSSMTLVKEIPKEDFPYKNPETGYAENPLCRLFFSERSQGFYNDGVGHLLSERNKADTYIKNATLRGARDSALPIKVLNIAHGKQDDVIASIDRALQDQRDGLVGVVLNETSRDGEQTIKGQIQNLNGAQIDTGAMNIVDGMVERDIVNMGINRQDVNSDPNKTAQAVSADNISANASIADNSKQNAEEIEHLLQMIIWMNAQLIKTSDKRYIKVSEKLGDKTMELENMTLGDCISLMKDFPVKVSVLETTGVMPDSAVEVQKGINLLQLVASTSAGSQAHAQVLSKVLEDSGYMLPASEVFAQPNPPEQPQPEQQQQPQMEQPQQPLM